VPMLSMAVLVKGLDRVLPILNIFDKSMKRENLLHHIVRVWL
jgi:hypothetical protein